jgi:hypothetical protein
VRGWCEWVALGGDVQGADSTAQALHGFQWKALVWCLTQRACTCKML